MILLTTEPIDVAVLEAAAEDPSAGGRVTFVGQVRDHHRGRAVLHLDYEAYEEMAREAIASILEETRARWSVAKIAVAHRLGHLEIGEAAVAIVVAAAHRAEAFEACRHVIDRIKEVVPIWKRETWADGTTEWVGPEEASERGAVVDG